MTRGGTLSLTPGQVSELDEQASYCSCLAQARLLSRPLARNKVQKRR
jgi:hypothetical protein